jgi:ubiquinone/menaquinone biosynthesis C-methylase UbiE
VKELPKGLANSGAVEIAQKLESISGGKMLDVATQKGGFINTMMKTLKDYERFVGIDISFEELDSIKEEFGNKPVEFIEMDATILNFSDNSFDTVSISHSLHHLEEIEKVLLEMKRVLKPGGCFIVQELFSDGEQSAAQQTDIQQHHWGAKIDTLLDVPHRKTFKKSEIIEMVKKIRLKELVDIETTHNLKCLYCDEKFNCEDPKNESVVEFAISEIDNDLKRLVRIKDHPNYHELKEEGEKLIEQVQTTGSASASSVFVVGKK